MNNQTNIMENEHHDRLPNMTFKHVECHKIVHNNHQNKQTTMKMI